MDRMFLFLCCFVLTACDPVPKTKSPILEEEPPKTPPTSPEIQIETPEKPEISEEREENAVLDLLPEVE